MNIKKGDNVIVKTGKDRGKKGKVLKTFPLLDNVVIEGVNVRKKRQRPRKSNEKGQILEIPTPVNASNVSIFCPSCGTGRRVGFKINKSKKVRVCVKCAKEL
ncbi:MAG: 50S ribosomal protein L24 [Patescibacteria group bacterium]